MDGPIFHSSVQLNSQYRATAKVRHDQIRNEFVIWTVDWQSVENRPVRRFGWEKVLSFAGERTDRFASDKAQHYQKQPLTSGSPAADKVESLDGEARIRSRSFRLF
jgi:hypothetical protein